MWKLTLLGVPRLEHEDRAQHLQRRKAWALLAYLAVSAQRHTRETLATLLWPEHDPRRARADLSRILSSLRNSLEDQLFSTDRESVALSGQAGIWVDVVHFRQLVEACRTVDSGRRPDVYQRQLAAAADLYQADFMAGFTLPGCPAFDEWQLLQSEDLRRDLAWALDSLTALSEEDDDLAQAISWAQRRVALDPLHEPAQQQLMRLYLRSGQRADAHRQYQALERLLAEELGVEPHPQTKQLYDEIRAGTRETVRPPAFLHGVTEDSDETISFVARDAELSRLLSHLNAALRGEGQLLFVTGGAGRGKTTLLQAFARRAIQAHSELVVAGGTCSAIAGAGDPYLPFREVLSLLSGDIPVHGRHLSMTREQARRLWNLLPLTVEAVLDHGPQLLDVFLSTKQLLTRAAAAAPPDAAWRQALDAGVRRLAAPGELKQPALIGQFTSLLQHLAHKQPLLIILDDLQWIDDASTALLFHLGRRLHGSRIFLVGAYRPDELLPAEGAKPHPLAQIVDEFRRAYGDIVIDLAAADRIAGRTFVDAYLDTEPNRLDRTFRDALFELTGGHPLFTVELLREMQSRGDVFQDSAGKWCADEGLQWQTLPARIEAVIARRIERLEADELGVLNVASVEGLTFTAEVLARVHDIEERRLLQMLARDLGRRHRLVGERGEAEVAGRFLAIYQFSHVLYQQYLYQRLDPGERRRLHADIASTLVELYGGEDKSIIGHLAHHYTAAGQWEQAVPYLVRAGDLAREKASLLDAVAHYETALRHWPAAGNTGQAETLRKLGECLWMLGRHEQALESLEAARELFRVAGSSQGVGATERLLGRVHWEAGRPQEAYHCFRRSLNILENEAESEELGWAWAGLSAYYMHLSEYDESLRFGERALALARQLGAEALTIQCLCDVGSALSGKGDWDGVALERESLALALASNRAHDAGRAYLYIVEALVYRGHYEEARLMLQEALAYTQRLHLTYTAQALIRQLVELDWISGRWSAALSRLLNAPGEGGDEPATDLASTYFGLTRGRINNDLGRANTAREELSSALSIPIASLDPRLALLGELARAETALGHMGAAATAIREILEWTDQVRFLYPNAAMALLFICRWPHATHTTETLNDARSAWRQLQRLDRQYGTQTTTACRLEGQGWLALAEQQAAQAEASFAQAAARWQALRHPYDQARALNGLSKARRRLGARDGARSAITLAVECVKKLEAQLEDATLRSSFLNSPLVHDILRDSETMVD